MIYVHNTLKQMIETGHSRWRWQKNTERVLLLCSERQQEILAHTPPGWGISLAAFTKYRSASQERQAVFLG